MTFLPLSVLYLKTEFLKFLVTLALTVMKPFKYLHFETHLDTQMVNIYT